MNVVDAFGKAFKSINPMEMAVDIGASLLGLPPEVKAAAKVAVGAATGNVLMAASGAVELVSGIAGKAATTEYAPSSEPAVASKGYAADTGALKPSDLEQTEKHLMSFQKFLPLLDKMGAWNLLNAFDGLFDKNSLKIVANLPQVPEELRAAARYFLQRPEAFAQLDVAARVGHSDGIVGLADIESMLDNVRAQKAEESKKAKSPIEVRALMGTKTNAKPVSKAKAPKKAESTKPRETKGTQAAPSRSSGKEIRDILNDPTLSLEEKIQLILNALLDKIDSQIEDTMDALADAQDRAGATKDKRTEGNKSQYASEAKDDREVERVTQRLQKLMEQKKAMNDLLSNMSMKFAEMTRTAINNMARA
jgi:hypothetical protein